MAGAFDDDLRRRNRKLAGILIACILALMAISAVVIVLHR